MALDSYDLALEAGEGTGRKNVGAFLRISISFKSDMPRDSGGNWAFGKGKT
jgi:hypothetical protein